MNSITEKNIEQGLASLKLQHSKDYVAWLHKLTAALGSFGAQFEDSLEDFEIAAEDFEQCGYSANESAALIFCLTQDDSFGMAVNSGNMIDRFLAYSV